MEIFYALEVLLIGWTGITITIVLVSLGIISKKSWLIILGALFAIPLSWYLGLTPKFRYIMYFLPLFFVGSAIAVKYGKNKLAWIFTLPYVGVIILIGYTVLSQ